MRIDDIRDVVERVVFPRSAIMQRLQELAKQVDRDYKGAENVIVVGMLNGGVPTMTHFLEFLDLNVEIDYLATSSYGDGTKSSGVVRLHKDLGADVSGKHVIIVEDIVDTGLTMKWLMEHMRQRGAVSVEILALIRRKTDSNKEVPVKYLGFELDTDEYLVGFGMDAAQRYRTLDEVASLNSKKIASLNGANS
jgi:hypoxanthine phosphoribosyltransferase